MHAIMIPYDMIHNFVCTGAREGQRLKRAVTIFIVINNN